MATYAARSSTLKPSFASVSPVDSLFRFLLGSSAAVMDADRLLDIGLDGAMFAVGLSAECGCLQSVVVEVCCRRLEEEAAVGICIGLLSVDVMRRKVAC